MSFIRSGRESHLTSHTLPGGKYNGLIYENIQEIERKF